MEEPTFLDAAPVRRRLSRTKLTILLAYPALLTIYLTVASPIHTNNTVGNLLDILFAIVTLIALLSWIQEDSRERDLPLAKGLIFGLVLCGYVAVPYYFFSSRGLKGGFLGLGLFLAYVVGALFVAVVVATVILILLTLLGLAAPFDPPPPAVR